MMTVATTLGKFRGLGPLGLFTLNNSTDAFIQFEKVISLILAVLTVSAGLWFVFQLFGGAMGWLASGGEKQALQNAQKRISNAIVGLLVVVFSYTIIAIISSIFGLYILSPWEALQGRLPQNTAANPPSQPPCEERNGNICP